MAVPLDTVAKVTHLRDCQPGCIGKETFCAVQFNNRHCLSDKLPSNIAWYWDSALLQGILLQLLQFFWHGIILHHGKISHLIMHMTKLLTSTHTLGSSVPTASVTLTEQLWMLYPLPPPTHSLTYPPSPPLIHIPLPPAKHPSASNFRHIYPYKTKLTFSWHFQEFVVPSDDCYVLWWPKSHWWALHP